MSAKQKHGTGIAWTHWPGTRGETWTVCRGCQLAKYKDAAGKPKSFKTCVQCYAMVQAASLVTRFDMPQYRGLTKTTSAGPVWNGAVFFDEEQLMWPLHCTKPRTFFLTSMGDVAYEKVTDDQLARIIAVMVSSGLRKTGHNFLVLTKRPDRLARGLNDRWFLRMVKNYVIEMYLDSLDESDVASQLFDGRIWWGTSIEDVASARWASSHLVQIPAPDRIWYSFEPMIEYVNVRALGRPAWLVLGGASWQRGAEAWPFSVDAALDVLDICREIGVPAYVKQLGAHPINTHGESIPMEKCDNHNANPEYWPSDLRVQEFPKVV